MLVTSVVCLPIRAADSVNVDGGLLPAAVVPRLQWKLCCEFLLVDTTFCPR